MTDYSHQTTEEALPREPLDYRSLLLGQLRGISAFTTTSGVPTAIFSAQFVAAVDLLATLLLPFHDQQMKDTLKKINVAELREMDDLGIQFGTRQQMAYADERLKACVLLMHRKGLLVKQSVGEEIEADEEPLAAAEPAKVLE